jgi:hypothetical protein
VNVVTRQVLSHVSAVVLGAGAGAGATVAVTHGAHEAITVAVGDSLVPRFSVRTDSVLRVVGSNIVVSKCGTSNIFLRTWKGSVQTSADTVDVTAPCAVPSSPTVASVDVCFIPKDSADKYHISGDTGVDVKNIPFPCEPTANLTLDPTKLAPAIQRRSVMFPHRPPPQTSGDLFHP